MNRTVEIKLWAVIVIVAVVVGAFAGGITWSDHLQHRFVTGLHAETVARQAAQTASQKQAEYTLCSKINGVLDAERTEISAAFTGSVTITPAEVAQLPATTRALLNDLEPLLHVSSAHSSITKAAVLATVPASATCKKPATPR